MARPDLQSVIGFTNLTGDAANVNVTLIHEEGQQLGETTTLVIPPGTGKAIKVHAIFNPDPSIPPPELYCNWTSDKAVFPYVIIGITREGMERGAWQGEHYTTAPSLGAMPATAGHIPYLVTSNDPDETWSPLPSPEG